MLNRRKCIGNTVTLAGSVLHKEDLFQAILEIKIQ